jgi:adenosylcobinamide-phosphate synthase
MGQCLVALLVALAVERWAGEPPVRWHPVVWMGSFLAWAGQRVQRLAGQGAPWTHRTRAESLPYFKAFWLAALYWTAGAAMVLWVTLVLQHGLTALADQLGPIMGDALAALVPGLLLRPLLAHGRERLSWLVSRDVAQLTQAQVRESAVESLAKNLNDSVVAPIFWFVLLDLPDAALYRFANTADAMWGYRGVYKGQNWQWAGKWAARADDVMSWLPARLTALLLAAVTGRAALGRLRCEARRTPSPNSGWPMAAMALSLGVRLQKPGAYVLNDPGRAPLPADTLRAIDIA